MYIYMYVYIYVCINIYICVYIYGWFSYFQLAHTPINLIVSCTNDSTHVPSGLKNLPC